MDCDKIKKCKDCKHFVQYPGDLWAWENKCGRTEKKVCDPVYGTAYYPNYRALLTCGSERQQSKDLLEYIFGERKIKCGREGQFWEAKE